KIHFWILQAFLSLRVIAIINLVVVHHLRSTPDQTVLPVRMPSATKYFPLRSARGSISCKNRAKHRANLESHSTQMPILVPPIGWLNDAAEALPGDILRTEAGSLKCDDRSVRNTTCAGSPSKAGCDSFPKMSSWESHGSTMKQRVPAS